MVEGKGISEEAERIDGWGREDHKIRPAREFEHSQEEEEEEGAAALARSAIELGQCTDRWVGSREASKAAGKCRIEFTQPAKHSPTH